jgi:hypothetical protein
VNKKFARAACEDELVRAHQEELVKARIDSFVMSESHGPLNPSDMAMVLQNPLVWNQMICFNLLIKPVRDVFGL